MTIRRAPQVLAVHVLPRRVRHVSARVTAVALAATLLPTAAIALATTSQAPRYAATASVTTHDLVVAPTQDAYVSQAAPRTPLGTSSQLAASSQANKTRITYLSFRVAGLPADATVVSARLDLRRTPHHLTSSTLQVRRVASSWSERTVTWRTRPALGSLVASQSVSPASSGLSATLPRLVRGNGSLSLAVTSTARTDVALLRSRETGSLGPRLVIRYTRPAPTPKPTTTAPSPTSTTSTPSPTSSTTTSTTTSPTSTTTSTTASPTSSTTSTPTTTSTTPTCTVSSRLVPSCGVLWGVAPGALTSTPRDEALATYESKIGRSVDVFHAYHDNDQLFPTAMERSLAQDPAHPRRLLLNWKPSTTDTWAQVAAGSVDARIDRLATYIKGSYTEPFFLTIYHEPEDNVVQTAGSGMTAQDYRAMYRHVALRLRADGVTNAVTVMNYMGYYGYAAQSWWGDLYPGDDVVDWIAWDPYAHSQDFGTMGDDFAALLNKRGGTTFPGFYNWATATHPGKPLMLAEWGVFERTTDLASKPQFFDTIPGQLGSFPWVKAMVYFDSPNAPRGDTRIDSTQESLTSFRSLTQTLPTMQR
jgi:beta-mannanase